MKKKVKILTTILSVLSVIVVLAIALLLFGKYKLDQSMTNAEALSTEISNNKLEVYAASTNIEKGSTLLTEDMIANDADLQKDGYTANVYKKISYTDMDASVFITEDNLRSSAVIDIPKDTPIQTVMTTKLSIAHDTREYEISEAVLMTDLKENEYVDIRIMYPNGIGMVVLPKKQVKNLSLENSVFFSYLTAEEIDRWESAVVDAFTISGTKLYVDRYVEENLQNPAIPNYLVKTETIDLINSDPNVIETASQTMNAYARLDLEQKLGRLTEDQLAAVAEGHGLQDTAKGSVLTENALSEADYNNVDETTTDETTDASTDEAVTDEATTESIKQ